MAFCKGNKEKCVEKEEIRKWSIQIGNECPTIKFLDDIAKLKEVKIWSISDVTYINI